MKLALFPLKKELNFFCKHLDKQNLKSKKIQTENHKLIYYEALKLVCTKGAHGKVEYALNTLSVVSELLNSSKASKLKSPQEKNSTSKSKVNNLEIELILCIGSAGALDKDLNIFDIVIGEKTIEHDYKIGFDTNIPHPTFKGSEKHIKEFSNKKSIDFKIHVGRIASGDEDIVDSSRSAILHNDTQTIAVAWEGAGGARAARMLKLPFLEIRGITDNANNNVKASFDKNLEKTMQNLASLFL